MVLELKYTARGFELSEAVQDAFRLCTSTETFASHLETHAQAPLKYFLVVLKKKLAGILSNLEPQKSLITTKQFIGMLEEITSPSYSKWGDFYPSIVLEYVA